MDPETENSATSQGTGGFKSSLHTLLTSRVALARHELKQAFRDRAQALAALLVAAMLVFFSWALLLAGSIAAISIASGWPWHLITLAFAALHLLVAILLVKSASSAAKSETFPVTRSEFQKDCEWLESLQNKPKSKN